MQFLNNIYYAFGWMVLSYNGPLISTLLDLFLNAATGLVMLGEKNPCAAYEPTYEPLMSTLQAINALFLMQIKFSTSNMLFR